MGVLYMSMAPSTLLPRATGRRGAAAAPDRRAAASAPDPRTAPAAPETGASPVSAKGSKQGTAPTALADSPAHTTPAHGTLLPPFKQVEATLERSPQQI